MLSKRELITTRDYVDADKNFIFSTWLRGLFYGNDMFREVPKDIFMENYHKIVERLLYLQGQTVKIACLKDDPEVILGYAVYRHAGNTLDYIFVKSAWRHIGIAKLLIPAELRAVTHITKIGLAVLKKKPGIVFNPFL